jgi:BBSome-interacting protein 1
MEEKRQILRKIEEIMPRSGLVFPEKGTLAEVLCKPKILPLKSITLQKIEEMERQLLQKNPS